MKSAKKIDIAYIFRFYWFYIVGAAAALAAVTGIFVNIIIKEPEPDYTVALICADRIEESELETLQSIFESAAEDINGDGKTWIQINTYAYAAVKDMENSPDPYSSVANAVWFQAELMQGESVLYLVRPYTYDTLIKLDSHFFLPASALLNVAEDTIQMKKITDGQLWQDFAIALHIPENRDVVQYNIDLLERLLNRQ